MNFDNMEGRYRIQGSCFEALWLITQELVLRLLTHFSTGEPLQVTFQEDLPLQDYFQLIDHHAKVKSC